MRTLILYLLSALSTWAILHLASSFTSTRPAVVNLRNEAVRPGDEPKVDPVATERRRQSGAQATAAARDQSEPREPVGAVSGGNNPDTPSVETQRLADFSELDSPPGESATRPVPQQRARRISVIPEIEPMLRGQAAEYHRQLEDEISEPSWAPFMEARFRGYLYSNPEILARNYQINVACGSTLCEMQGVGYGSTIADWFDATSDLPDQDWFEFSNADSFLGERDDAITVVTIFRKSDDGSTSQSSGEASPQVT